MPSKASFREQCSADGVVCGFRHCAEEIDDARLKMERCRHEGGHVKRQLATAGTQNSCPSGGNDKPALRDDIGRPELSLQTCILAVHLFALAVRGSMSHAVLGGRQGRVWCGV
jgi:hypothetical protein